MSISRTRKSRFGGDPGSRLSYTPTVSRALIEDTSDVDLGPIPDRVTPSDLVPAWRDSWEELGHVPTAGDSDLPLPLVTQHDGDNSPVQELGRLPRDSLDLGADSIAPAPMAPLVAPAGGIPRQSAPSRSALEANEHPLWASARRLLASGQSEAAADLIEQLCLEQPGHETGRAAALQLSIALGRIDRVGVHAAWLLRGYLQSQRPADACTVYQRVRSVLPSAPLPEVVLVAALSAADATGSGPVVLDATNMLLKQHAASAQTPQALLLAAKHQFGAGAMEAAVQTLRYLVESFPTATAAEPARRKLAELGFL